MNMDQVDFLGFNKKKDKQPVAEIQEEQKENGSDLKEKDCVDAGAVTADNLVPNDRYKNNHTHLGVAVIFNHTSISGQAPRKGTDRDKTRFASVMRKYGFEVRIYDDLAYAKILEVLKEVSQEDHTKNDCLCITVMSHGLAGKVFARDRPYPVEDLWTNFLGNRCKSLVNKPKLFFIQACRGERFDSGVKFRSLSFDTTDSLAHAQPTYTIPSTADLIFMYSTFEGNYSWRNPINGSWFIQTLCVVLEETFKEDPEDGAELFDLLTAVSRRVAFDYQSNVPNDETMDRMKQMPCFMSTLTKKFYLKRKA